MNNIDDIFAVDMPELDYVPFEEDVETSEDVNLLVFPEQKASSSSSNSSDLPDDLLTNDTFNDGIDYLAGLINPDAIEGEVVYQDAPVLFNNRVNLPSHTVIFEVNGYETYFPSSYSDDLFVLDGLLVNLGANYTAGVQMDGSDVSNYLSSEITIPTYHSSTWYQYLQTYGQPYRIVDRYVSSNGYISSSTRQSVNIEWSGGNPWAGFTFDRIGLLFIMLLLVIIFVFKKGR